ncbi:MAG: DUF420 domain-containing protein [Halorientalis sp.]
MDHRARDHVPLLTALLSVASLALVFGAVLRVVPSTALPHPPIWVLAAIPHVNAVLSLLAIVGIVVGVRAIRQGHVERHRRAMLTTLALFGTFLALYLFRVALEGPTPFDGPAVVERFVYYPVLAIHVLLAIVCIPLLYYVLLLALTRPVRELRGSTHPRVGRVAASLWLVSFVLGTVVYGLLYVAW